MPLRRISKANSHAVPLLMDIIESTAYMPGVDLIKNRLTATLASGSADDLSLGSCNHFIVFEDHFPLGFIGLSPMEDCGEIIGPCLYRDCFGRGLGEHLLEHLFSIARLRELRLLFVLAGADAPHAASFLVRQGFEPVSSDHEFIKRWRDGLLADIPLQPATTLFARLLDVDI
jgi:N-acetylglutamate synthase-like GNAT family acetyltransferase